MDLSCESCKFLSVRNRSEFAADIYDYQCGLSYEWIGFLPTTPESCPIMDILFIVVEPETKIGDKVLYYCRDLISLFHLRKVFNASENAEVYRWMRVEEEKKDFFACWEQPDEDFDRWWWYVCEEASPKSLGFRKVSFSSLEFNYKLLLKMRGK